MSKDKVACFITVVLLVKSRGRSYVFRATKALNGYQFGGMCSLGDEQSPERKVMNTHLKAEGLNPITDAGFC